MNELEQMLRADLRDVAGTVDIPISVDAVAAERDRLDTEERRARWGGRVLAAAVAAVLLTFAVWWVQTNVFRVPDALAVGCHLPHGLPDPRVGRAHGVRCARGAYGREVRLLRADRVVPQPGA